MSFPSHILVFGATGLSGATFCELALERNIKLTLYLRTPSKLKSEIANNELASIIEGTYEDADGLAKAAQCGAEAFVSFAGPVIDGFLHTTPGKPITNAYSVLLPLLLENNFNRVMVLSTPSYQVSEDSWSVKWTAGANFIRFFANNAYRDVIGSSEVVSKQSVEKLNWTIFRVPLLTNGQGALSVKGSYIGDSTDGLTLSRKGMATWVLQELQAKKWIGKAPILSE